MRKCYDEWAVSKVVCEGAQGSPQRGGNRVVRAIYFEVEVEGWNFSLFVISGWSGVVCGVDQQRWRWRWRQRGRQNDLEDRP